MRPQLLDRFGLSVQVGTIMDSDLRTQMVLDRIAYESDPDALAEAARPEQEALSKQLMDARERLRKVQIPMDLQLLISDICSRYVGLRKPLSVPGKVGACWQGHTGRACKDYAAGQGWVIRNTTLNTNTSILHVFYSMAKVHTKYFKPPPQNSSFPAL